MNDPCGDFRAMFDALLDGDLPDGDRALVTSHLETCGDCREEWRRERELVELLEQLPDPRCPERVVAGIRTGTWERRVTAPISDPQREIRGATFRVPPAARWVAGGLAAAIVAFLLIRVLAPAPPIAFAPGEVSHARNLARWSVTLALVEMGHAEREAADRAILDRFPAALNRSIREATTKPSGGSS